MNWPRRHDDTPKRRYPVARIDDYAQNPQQALIDAAAEPALRRFIDDSDLEWVTVDRGDGTQAQVQALARGSVRKVIERIVAEGRAVQANIKDWICSPNEFNLCAKLDTPPGKLMRLLNDFLNTKYMEGGIEVAGLAALFTAPAVGIALQIFSALGFINRVFVELCDCPSVK